MRACQNGFKAIPERFVNNPRWARAGLNNVSAKSRGVLQFRNETPQADTYRARVVLIAGY